jgi:hypothetical protein
MGKRVDARDVLDANGRTRRAFRGRIVGHYRRTGPNAWDDYEYVGRDEGEIEVLPDLEVQTEAWGALFRLRSGGRVVRVEWLPDAAARRELRGAAELRRYFLDRYIQPFEHARGLGAAAVIADKLDD